MKVTIITCDWKEDFGDYEKDIKKILKEIGGKKERIYFDQGDIDENILFLSSIPLTQEQCEELWIKGDLYLGDKIFSGRNYKEILKKVKEYYIQEAKKEMN